MRSGVLAIAAAVLAIVAFSGVASALLEASLDKSVYVVGERVTVTGRASPGDSIVIYVLFDGNIVDVANVKAGQDGGFQWVSARLTKPGNYVVRILNLNTSEITEISFTVRAAASITGKVVDENNQPLEGVKVVAMGDGREYEATTGADGVFTLYVDPGTYTIRFSKVGYLSKVVENVQVRQVGETKDIGTVKMESLEYVVKMLGEAIRSLNESLGLKADKADVEQLQHRVDMLGESIALLNQSLQQVQAELGKKADKADLEQVSQQLQELASQLQQQLEQLQGQLAGIQQQVQQLAAGKADAAAVEQLRQQLQQLNASLAQQIASVSEKLGTLEKRVDTLEAATKAISDLQNAVKDLQQAVQEFRKTAQQLQKEIQDASNQAKSASSRAMAGLAAGIIGIIVAIVALVLVYRKIAA